MLKSMRLSNIFVLNQDEALEFYVGKLGLEVAADMEFGPMRWLTVRVPGDNDREIFLELVGPPSLDPKHTETVKEMVSAGATGFAAGFTTDDIQAFYEHVRDQGVEITQEPMSQGYGTDIGIRDPFGNHLRVTQFGS